jgi:hypothetical protein
MPGTILKMRDKLDEAIRLASGVSPEVNLIRITGLGIHSDGTVQLGRPNDFVSRWEFAFMDDKEGEAPPFFVSVLYLKPGKPLVTPSAGNVMQSEYFDEEVIPELHDSDALVELFNDQPDYKPMGGNNQDAMVYSMRRALGR